MMLETHVSLGLIQESILLVFPVAILFLFLFVVFGNVAIAKAFCRTDDFYQAKIQNETLKLQNQLDALKSDLESHRTDSKLKSRFYANITHEFRTPLTLLLAPLEEAYQNDSGNFNKAELLLMLKNSKKILRLINQLLEISKIEWGGSDLSITRGDMAELLSTISSFFLSMAEKRKIDFERNMPLENPLGYFDPEKVEKIVTNLLSNSFKFTPSNGRVSFSSEFRYEEYNGIAEADRIEITVSDTGVGVDSEKIPKLFELFYSSDTREGREFEGSGIGLALVKELVEKCKGSIKVINQQPGVKFIVSLPIHKKYFSDDEITQFTFTASQDKINELEYLDSPVGAIISSLDKEEFENMKNAALILVVEDNEDLRILIRDRFSKAFVVKEAKNGLEGLALAMEIVPDLIITDLVMPRMSGLELCEHIKEDERTSHIPVIMLTGKSEIEEKIEGLETGADDYLTKPFNINELQVRVKNLIDQRRKIKQRYEQELHLPRTFKVIGKDEIFLEKAIKSVERNLANSNFSVEDFQKEMGMSRMQLHRKLKALSEKSTSEFIRLIRMKKAAEMILEGSGTISEIAYEVGFNDPSYFTKCFRNEFGTPPSEYRQLMDNPR